MAFWNKKNEDPWEIDPNRKREPVMFYERAPEPQPEPEVNATSGLAEPVGEEVPEEAMICPWCGKEMTRAYLLGGRDAVCFSDQKPAPFLGSLGHEKTYLGDGGFWRNYQSCWQCKPCYKLVVEIPKPTGPNYVWENGKVKLPEDSFARWDGNPVAPFDSEKQEKEE